MEVTSDIYKGSSNHGQRYNLFVMAKISTTHVPRKSLMSLYLSNSSKGT